MLHAAAVSRCRRTCSYRHACCVHLHLQAALQKAVGERRVQEAVLNVAVGNSPALRLYRRLGFADRSQVDDYYGPVSPNFSIQVSSTFGTWLHAAFQRWLSSCSYAVAWTACTGAQGCALSCSWAATACC